MQSQLVNNIYISDWKYERCIDGGVECCRLQLHLPPVFKADEVEDEDGGQDVEGRPQADWKASQLRPLAS